MMNSYRPGKLVAIASVAVRSPRSVVHARRAIGEFRALQRLSELAGALEVLERLRPRVVLEIGSHLGGTLYAWSTVATRDALIVTVDIPFEGSPGLQTPKRLVRDAQRIEHVTGDSHAESTLAEVKHVLAGAGVDFLFIDGDHTLDGVTNDLNMYGPLVRDGGIIGFHDVIRKSGAADDQVWRLWDRLRTLAGAREFADPDARRDGGMGIGLITMTAEVRTTGAWQTH